MLLSSQDLTKSRTVCHAWWQLLTQQCGGCGSSYRPLKVGQVVKDEVSTGSSVESAVAPDLCVVLTARCSQIFQLAVGIRQPGKVMYIL
jgi:hypothetical protein